MSLDVRVDPGAAHALALGVVVLDGVTAIRIPDPFANPRLRVWLDCFFERLASEPDALARMYEEGRRIYKRFGIDPTKHRPSSEQLLRRLARGAEHPEMGLGELLPRVNPLVDAINICQVQERLPYGLYDLAAVTPPIVARVGLPGEGYEGIRKGRISLDGRPALFDREGPFGNPSSDSDRAKTSGSTRRALAVIFGSAEKAYAEWEKLLDRTIETLLMHVEASVLERRVVAGGRG